MPDKRTPSITAATDGVMYPRYMAAVLFLGFFIVVEYILMSFALMGLPTASPSSAMNNAES
jgi:hypothetical protein